MAKTIVRINLLATGLPDHWPHRGDYGPIGCRLCGKRFTKWMGVPSHAQAHIRKDLKNPQIRARILVSIESIAQGGRYRYDIPRTEARYFHD